MSGSRSLRVASLLVDGEQPLIGIPVEIDGKEAVCYFFTEAEADEALASRGGENALTLAGAWSGLPWEDVAAALDRIRDQSPPSEPISL